MAQTLNLKIAGRYSFPNQLSEVPQGALNTADNVVVDRESIAESRRGNNKYGTQLNTEGGVIDKIFSFDDTLLVSYHDSYLAYDSGSGVWVDYDGYFASPDDDNKIRALEANQNLYITTSTGVQKLQEVTGAWVSAGVVPALDGYADLINNTGFMEPDTAVAYRLVWGYNDANNNEIVGAPSQRLILINDTDAYSNTDHRWYIPDTITTSYFYRLYRSDPSAGAAFEPDDELQQVREGNPDATDISNGYVTFTDIVPDDLRGAFLYTDQSQETLAQANYTPPFAKDLALYKGFTFYANTRQKQRYFSTLIAVGDNDLNYQINDGYAASASTTVSDLESYASLIVQDLTYTASAIGVDGNLVTIEYTGGATAGAEVVSVENTATIKAVSIQIEDGVSTATQLKTAFDASGPALTLATVAVSGVGGDAQNISSVTSLDGGFDTSLINVGMRVVAANIPADTRVVSIDSNNTITIDQASTANGTRSFEFQDVFRIDSLEYFATTDTDIANSEFKVFSAGTVAQNIQNTTVDLIRAINQDAGNSIVYAYYLSGFEDLPGQMLIEERAIGGAAFSLTSTNGDSFSPILPASGTSQISDNEEKINRIHISKFQQPEACPLLQYVPVGSANDPILRILALKDALIIFKKNDGIFSLTGENVPFNVTSIDYTTKLRAPESAITFNNQVFCCSSQGIVAVTPDGVKIVSRPIENDIKNLLASQFTYFESVSFGISYESDRKYIFFTVETEEDTVPTQAHVYNSLTNSWTRWPLTFTCGLVNPFDDKLYMGSPDNDYVYQERKSFTRLDYADDEIAVTIVSSSGVDVVLTDTSGIEIGWTLKQNSREAIITQITDSQNIVVDTDLSWTVGSATAYKPILVELEWVPNTAQNPGILKHWSDVSVIFKQAGFSSINLAFKTNDSPTYEGIDLVPKRGGGWGTFPWGTLPWGGGTNLEQIIPTYVPEEKAWSNWIITKVTSEQAFNSFGLEGISVFFDPQSQRFR